LKVVKVDQESFVMIKVIIGDKTCGGSNKYTVIMNMYMNALKVVMFI